MLHIEAIHDVITESCHHIVWSVEIILVLTHIVIICVDFVGNVVTLVALHLLRNKTHALLNHEIFVFEDIHLFIKLLNSFLMLLLQLNYHLLGFLDLLLF